MDGALFVPIYFAVTGWAQMQGWYKEDSFKQTGDKTMNQRCHQSGAK